MAAKSRPSTILCLSYILSIISGIPKSFSQSCYSPQNIQTFYPISAPSPAILPPPFPVNDPPNAPQPTTPIPPPQPQPRRTKSSTRAAVGTAIGVTAASTLALSVLIFFLLLRHSRRKRKRDAAVTTNEGSPVLSQSVNFRQFNSKVKGVIVDENGLDVVYWRNLEGGDNRTSFKKQQHRSSEDEQQEQERRMVGDKDRMHEPPLAVGSPPPPPSCGGALASPSRPPAPTGLPNKCSLSPGEGTEGKEDGQVELKPLDKGSSKFDGDLMEALFGHVAKYRKSGIRSGGALDDQSGPPSQIFILDTSKSLDTASVVKSLGITREEIVDALNKGQGLNADTLEQLARVAPTDEEASEILAFGGDPTRLADAECFLYHILKAVPSAFARFSTMHLRSNYDVEVSHLKESLQCLEAACKELRTRGLFLKLLQAVLRAGNCLNTGSARAFDLTALIKLSDMKSSDGRTTLLQFVVQEVVRDEGKRCVLNQNRGSSSNAASQSPDGTASKDDIEREYMMLGLPVIGGLSAEFSNVKRAATLGYDLVINTSSTLTRQLAEIQKMVGQGGDGGFAGKMRGFLDTAELEMKLLKEEQTRVMEVVEKTRDYHQAGPSKDPFQLFAVVKDFLGMIDQACVEIARNVQKNEDASSVGGPASLGYPRVFRFPKLPVDFVSDKSKGSQATQTCTQMETAE